MRTDISGRVALVTGAGRGIGRSIALALAGAGVRTFITARSGDQLEDTAHEIRALGHETAFVAADVASEEGVERIFSSLEKTFGSLDILVNNAGHGISGPLADFPVESFDSLMASTSGVCLCAASGQ